MGYQLTCQPCSETMGLLFPGPHHLPATCPQGTGIFTSVQFLVCVVSERENGAKRIIRLIAGKRALWMNSEVEDGFINNL